MRDLCSSEAAAGYLSESKITLITYQQATSCISMLDELKSSILPIQALLTTVGACTACRFLCCRHIYLSD